MKNILITGSNRGIGLELTRAFVQGNWHVHACCRAPKEAQELQALARKVDNLAIHHLEVKKPEQIEALSKQLSSLRLDLLLNNAGIFGPRPAQLEVKDVEGWLETYQVNSIAPLQMAIAFQSQLARSKKPVVATISSAMGSISENCAGGDYAYRASKAAINMINKGLSIDFAPHKITCVVLHPGWVHTRMGGPQAPLSPAESAAGLMQVLTNLTPKENGKFFDYTGRERNW